MADFDPSSKPSRTRAFIETGSVRDDDPSRRSLGFGEQREGIVSQYQQWRDVSAHGPCAGGRAGAQSSCADADKLGRHSDACGGTVDTQASVRKFKE